MEFAEDFADDLRALAVRLGGSEAELVHAEENPAVHRLQAVAHVGQRAADDYAHGVIEIGFFHLRFDIDRSHHLLLLLVSHSAPPKPSKSCYFFTIRNLPILCFQQLTGISNNFALPLGPHQALRPPLWANRIAIYP